MTGSSPSKRRQRITAEQDHDNGKTEQLTNVGLHSNSPSEGFVHLLCKMRAIRFAGTCEPCRRAPIILIRVAHWCSRLTRCPLKAETTGSSPVCAAKLDEGRWNQLRRPFLFAMSCW